MEEIIPNEAQSPRYDLATLWFGANDAALPNRCKSVIYNHNASGFVT